MDCCMGESDGRGSIQSLECHRPLIIQLPQGSAMARTDQQKQAVRVPLLKRNF